MVSSSVLFYLTFQVEVFYKRKLEADDRWKRGGRKSLRQRRAFELKNLDPCETYQVRVVVDRAELPPPFQVGPFLQTVNQTWAYLENSEDNPHFLRKYGSNISANLNITSYNTSANIRTTDLCAKSVSIVVHPENCTRDSHQSHVAANSEVKVEELKPCTKYNVKIDLFLNSKLENTEFNLYLNSKLEEPLEASDFRIPNAASFFTTPSGNELANHVKFDRTSKNLSWNFNPFLQQPCALHMEGEVKLTIEGSRGEEIELEGSKNLNSECDRKVVLRVNLTKPGWTEHESFVAFSQVVAGHHVRIAEKVLLEDEGQSLRLVADQCQGWPTMIELKPIHLLGEIIYLPINKSWINQQSGPGSSNTVLLLSLKELPAFQWATCADYQVGDRGQVARVEIQSDSPPGAGSQRRRDRDLERVGASRLEADRLQLEP